LRAHRIHDMSASSFRRGRRKKKIQGKRTTKEKENARPKKRKEESKRCEEITERGDSRGASLNILLRKIYSMRGEKKRDLVQLVDETE